jgi:hypothetical protein
MKKSEFNTAEFRVKTPGVRWEECEVVDTLEDARRCEADERAQDLADLYGEEVRWNWVGGSNGHYFGGRP